MTAELRSRQVEKAKRSMVMCTADSGTKESGRKEKIGDKQQTETEDNAAESAEMRWDETTGCRRDM